MAIREYEKIVRTKIPDIIRQKGSEPQSIELPANSETTPRKFHKKFKEEVEELIQAKASDEILDEAADVLQVLVDYISLHGYTFADLELATMAKAVKRGRFLTEQNMVVYLTSVNSPD